MNRYASVLMSLLTPAALAAQTAGPAPTEISTASRAEVRIPADRATLVIAVETRGSTAAAAASDNARISSAVLAALKSTGVEGSQVGSAGYIVRQNWRFESPNRPPKADGYVAENAIRIDITKLDRIGTYIDSSLAAGATRANDVTFSAGSTEQARLTALANAMATARGAAAVMAKAAGGSVGRLLGATTQGMEPNSYIQIRGLRAMNSASADAAEPTTIVPREIVVSVMVSTRWQVDFP
jgi:uncharacterized protein YggE